MCFNFRVNFEISSDSFILDRKIILGLFDVYLIDLKNFYVTFVCIETPLNKEAKYSHVIGIF